MSPKNADSDARSQNSNNNSGNDTIRTSEISSSPGFDYTKRDFGLLPVPRKLQHDPERPVHFGLWMQILFGFASTFTVGNLYWCQPILIKLSRSFGVSYSEVSIVPTLLQAGYATGLLFISPLGDLVRRRQLILIIVLCAATLSIGLAITDNVKVFEALSYLVGIFTVTPQILVPLAVDLAPPEKKSTAIAVVLSGLMFGILIARVLSGVVAQYADWRVVYYMAIGVQYLVLALCYLFIPDYPAKDLKLSLFGYTNIGAQYLSVLWSMAKYAVTEPILIQSCFIMAASAAGFTNFWVTLTFLLGDAPYNYSTLVIGLFGLIGMAGVSAGPFIGRMLDHLGAPWYSSLLSALLLLVFQGVETAAGGINVAAVVIVTFGLDVCRQLQQVSATSAVFGIAPEARARLNALLVLSVFIGQVVGTITGTAVFVNHGWRAASGLNMAFYGSQVIVLLLRGPYVDRYTWFGYQNGWRKKKGTSEDASEVEKGLEEKTQKTDADAQ